jgi:hypothetical protein
MFRGIAPLLFASLLVAGTTPAASTELTGCWRHLVLQPFDGLAVEPTALFMGELCFPSAARFGNFKGVVVGYGCGLGLNMRYRLGRGTIKISPSQWGGLTGVFTYRFGKRGETLILHKTGEEPLIFERF